MTIYLISWLSEIVMPDIVFVFIVSLVFFLKHFLSM